MTWSPTLYQGEVPVKSTRPTFKSLLLAGVLRGLWETDPEADVRYLDIYPPDQSLVKSFRSPPASFSNLKASLKMLIFTSLPPGDCAMPLRPRISPRAPFPDLLSEWR